MKHGIRLLVAFLAAWCVLFGVSALAEDTNGLVVYFSRTGNTQEAALELAALTGADLARIERTEPYPAGNDAFLALAEQDCSGEIRLELMEED